MSSNRRKQSYAPSLGRPHRRYRSVTASSSTQKEMVATARRTFATDLWPMLLCWGLSIIVCLSLFRIHKEIYKPSTNAAQGTSSWVFADEEINIGPTITVSEFKWGCPPSPHVHATLREQLWCENIDTVEETFNTEFIQGTSPFSRSASKTTCAGVLYGTLPRDAFDTMRLQDAYWEMHTSRIWMKACKKAKCSPELERFLSGLAEDCKTTAKQTLKTYDIAIDDITPTPTTTAFVGHLQRVDKTYPVEYNVITVDVNLRLWYELALRMKNKGELKSDARFHANACLRCLSSRKSVHELGVGNSGD